MNLGSPEIKEDHIHTNKERSTQESIQLSPKQKMILKNYSLEVRFTFDFYLLAKQNEELNTSKGSLSKSQGNNLIAKHEVPVINTLEINDKL